MIQSRDFTLAPAEIPSKRKILCRTNPPMQAREITSTRPIVYNWSIQFNCLLLGCGANILVTCYIASTCVLKVSPHMTPFYVWFTVIASTLVAAVLAEALHVNLPVPWTGLAIVGLVFVVASLPMLYGHMYVPDVIMLQREGISIHRISNERTRSDGSLPNGSTGDYRLEDDDLLEGEGFPLLGSVDNVGDSRTLDLNSPNMTWKQCLKVGDFDHCGERYET